MAASQRLRNFHHHGPMDPDNEVAVTESQDTQATQAAGPASTSAPGTATSRTRSLSDGGNTPKLWPSPHIIEAPRRSKDDITIRDKDHEPSGTAGPGPFVPSGQPSLGSGLSSLSSLSSFPSVSANPSTPIRAGFLRGLSLQMPTGNTTTDSASPVPQSGSYLRPAPLSPTLDGSHIYASPSSILPRRSRGLDYSRAATSLHHSTLASQASPDSSPTIGSRAMNIPSRRNDGSSGADQASTSLWSMMGSQERMQVSSSVGSTLVISDVSSSSSDDDDYMDEDIDEIYVTTPQASRLGVAGTPSMSGAAPWLAGSPALNNPSFQQRQRPRKIKQPKRRLRGPLGFASALSRSPPSGLVGPKDMSPHSRRESISWAANQLHISGNDSDDSLSKLDTHDSPVRPSIVRRAVTRRGNLLPKIKSFARVRAALMEESAPIEHEVRREAEVIRQVRGTDMDLEPRPFPPAHPHPRATPAATTAGSSQTQLTHDSLDELSEDVMMVDPSANALGLSLKQQALRNSNRHKAPWDTISETSSVGGGRVTTPPPASFHPARSSLEDITMGSPSASSTGASQTTTTANQNTASSSSGPNCNTQQSSGPRPPGSSTNTTGPSCPSAAELTRRINSKRRARADDDLDPASIKRRAVSPGMSVHGSPVMQSPLQRVGEGAPWGGPERRSEGTSARPGSVGDLSAKGGSEGVVGRGKSIHYGLQGRVGYQGMVETNDGITRLSIE